MEKQEKLYDVVGIGNPLLDFIVEVSDERLDEIGLTKGTMQLIDADESARLLGLLDGDTVMVAPGGSSANTVAGTSVLGGSTVFIGKVGDDAHGCTYVERTTESGVLSRLTPHLTLSTGHAITFITPDGERTFATHLGAALGFRDFDIDEIDIAQSQYLHLEGYQLAGPDSLKAVYRAIEIAKDFGTRVSIDLSDAGVISGNLDLIKKLLRESVDMVFVNEVEAEALTGKNAEDAVDVIAAMCDMAVVKVGGGGSYIKSNGVTHKVPVYATTVVNTNGAGDMYAGGVIYGLTHGRSPMDAGHIGSFAASRVVSQKEARLSKEGESAVRDFIAQIGVKL